MINIITGIVAMAGVIIFLGNYAYNIESWPLTFFIVGVLLMPVYDFYRSLKARQKSNGNGDAGTENPDEIETVRARDPGTMKETER